MVTARCSWRCASKHIATRTNTIVPYASLSFAGFTYVPSYCQSRGSIFKHDNNSCPNHYKIIKNKLVELQYSIRKLQCFIYLHYISFQGSNIYYVLKRKYVWQNTLTSRTCECFISIFVRGMRCWLNLRNPLSLVFIPNLGPISPTVTPTRHT